RSQHDPSDTVWQQRNVEVHEESSSQLRDLQLAAHLGVVNRMQSVDGLELDDEVFRDDEVDAVRVKAFSSVNHRKPLLSLERNIGSGQFESRSALIDRLTQSGPKRFVYLD